MSTDRLFEEDAYVVKFQAQVIGHQEIEGKKGVVLNRTFFYPTGGGQPHDTGCLNDIPVIDVQDINQNVVHFLKDGQILSPGDVQGCVDWNRRFDHMQQHSGQHVLSAAFVQVASAHTQGFHLGTDLVTIDLDRSDVDWPLAHQVENWANTQIWTGKPVKIMHVSQADIPSIPFRRAPKVSGDLRVVEIDNTDWSACCGTHVRNTGEIGLIKIIRIEKYKSGSRIHFICGQRALSRIQVKQQALDQVARLLSGPEEEAPEAVERLQFENKMLKKGLRELEMQLLTREAEKLAESAEDSGKFSVINAQLPVGDMKALQQMARTLTGVAGRLVILGSVTDRSNVVIARSENVDIDVRPLLNRACELLHGRGGGTEAMAQGSGEPVESLQQILLQIASQLRDGQC